MRFPFLLEQIQGWTQPPALKYQWHGGAFVQSLSPVVLSELPQSTFGSRNVFCVVKPISNWYFCSRHVCSPRGSQVAQSISVPVALFCRKDVFWVCGSFFAHFCSRWWRGTEQDCCLCISKSIAGWLCCVPWWDGSLSAVLLALSPCCEGDKTHHCACLWGQGFDFLGLLYVRFHPVNNAVPWSSPCIQQNVERAAQPFLPAGLDCCVGRSGSVVGMLLKS